MPRGETVLITSSAQIIRACITLHCWADVPPHEDAPTFVHHDGPPDDAGVAPELDQVVLDAHLGLQQLPELDVAEVPDMAVLSITII